MNYITREQAMKLDEDARGLVLAYQEGPTHMLSTRAYVVERRLGPYRWARVAYGRPIVGRSKALELARKLAIREGVVWRVREVGPVQEGEIIRVEP